MTEPHKKMSYNPGPVFDYRRVDPVFLLDLYNHYRQRHGTTAIPPRHLIDNAWIECGYILDAPDLMPAGGCASFEFQHDLDLGPGIEQLTTSRED